MVDFLLRQAHALRQTGKLCAIIVIATLATTLVNGLVIGYVCLVFVEYALESALSLATVFLWATVAGTLASTVIVGVGTLTSLFKHRKGGSAIAEELGGKPISQIPVTAEIQRLRNVVEEMAIAYSMPCPQLYLLEGQPSINAFAAGYAPASAVIGVTEGCIRHLDRDQLQGVMAHEFSHIRFGDMRLNMHLDCIVSGLRGIMTVAEHLIETGQEELESRHLESDHKNSAIGALLLIALGCAMWPVGLAGSLAASMVVLAISRQREYLADARAVQATRNPQGLANALRRISGLDHRRLRGANTRSVAHMMFSLASGREHDWLATHPPIEKRILALDPNWDHTPLFEDHNEIEEYTGAFGDAIASIGGAAFSGRSSPSPVANNRPDDTRVPCDQQSSCTEFTLGLESVDAELVKVVTAPEIVPISFPLLLRLGSQPQLSLDAIVVHGHEREIANGLSCVICSLDTSQSTALLSQIVTELRGVPANDRARISARLDKFRSQLDEHAWNEYAWLWLAQLQLGTIRVQPGKVVFGRAKQLIEPLLEVLSLASHLDGGQAMAEYRFQRGWCQLGLDQVSPLPLDVLSWHATLAAIEQLSQASARIKRDILVALGCIFSGDGDISQKEVGFLRVVRIMLGVGDIELVSRPASELR